MERFETTLDLTLPQGYRTHLLEIGYGAGPYYGLFSPKEVCDELNPLDGGYIEGFGLVPNPKADFPFNQADASRIKQSRAALEPEFWGNAPYPPLGAIPIAHHGCSVWTMLVTSGELRGTVWDAAAHGGFNGLWVPSRRPPGIVKPNPTYKVFPESLDLLTFDEWYDAWLEAALHDLTMPPEPPARGKGLFELFSRFFVAASCACSAA